MLDILALGNPTDGHHVRPQIRNIDRNFDARVTLEKNVFGRFRNPSNPDADMKLSPEAQRDITRLVQSNQYDVVLISDNLRTGLDRLQCCIPEELKNKVLVVFGGPSPDSEKQYRADGVTHFTHELDIGKNIVEMVKERVPQEA